ncbi:MAG: FAD-binding oxidoreductase, partial [Patescibacteria group bacterium]
MNHKENIKTFFKGEILEDGKTLATYSRDASLLEVKPALVVFPQDADDVAKLVSYVAEHKKEDPVLSLTARAAGTDMSGGPLNESIIMDFTKHITGILSVNEKDLSAEVLPGTFYRDFEKETLAKGLLLPCYTASKNLCAIGGMIANNSGGEKTLIYGKIEDYVAELNVIFSDGKEYRVMPLGRDQLQAKMAQKDFEGEIYRKMYELIEANYEKIKAAKPKVKKNSAGLYLWNVWDRETGIFDLTKLIVGSQGTLGLVTKAKFKLVPIKKHSKLYVIFMPRIDRVSDVVNELLPFKPESLESYD